MGLQESGLKVFKIVDASGTDYCVLATDMKDAYISFKQFLVSKHSGTPDVPDNPDEWEDPQSISVVGDFLIIVETEQMHSAHDAAAGEQLRKDSDSSTFRDPAPIDDIPF